MIFLVPGPCFWADMFSWGGPGSDLLCGKPQVAVAHRWKNKHVTLLNNSTEHLTRGLPGLKYVKCKERDLKKSQVLQFVSLGWWGSYVLKRNSFQMTRRLQYFFLLDQQGRERKGEEARYPGACLGPSGVERWPWPEPLAPALGPGVAGICPVLCGRSFQPEQEERTAWSGDEQSRHRAALHAHRPACTLDLQSLQRGLLGQTSFLLEGTFRCSET